MSAADQLFTQAIERKNGQSLTQEELTKRYYDAIRDHPFVHRGNYHTCVRRNSLIFNENNNNSNNSNNNNNNNVSHIRDSNGNTVCILLRNAFPKKVTELATSVLNDAATRTSLRANIFGGESPFSGIAGYYDYWGSPIEYKCRKTSFTCETIEKWPRVFPLVEYASKLYEKICPEAYEGQEKAIPKAVQIHGSPFSTLTINQRFRTAMHTDAGDFDDGFGLISVLDGSFEGCHLGFPYFGVCVELRVGDLIFFETHHCHANTELELLPVKGQPMNYWSRLSCVFYYRAVLGEEKCKTEYERRLKNEKKAKGVNNNSITFDDETKELVDQQRDPKTHQSLLKNGVPENENGENYNRPATVFSAGLQTPFNSLLIHRLPDAAGASLSPISLIQQVFNKEAENILKYADQLASFSSSTIQQQEETSSSFVKSATELFLYLFNELPREPVLFNERISSLLSFRPNSSNFGLFQRSSISFHPVDTNKESLGARQSAPATGGFSETASFVKFASDESVQRVFAEDSLNQVLTPALLDMWNDAKALWFSKVLIDWKKIKDRHDSSDDESEFKFNWNNTGDVNKTFFDLCDVASEVMLAMLQQEEASPGQKARFWAAFAYHLFKECQSVNEMPETAITMKKLNVKLKDYQFGGTRYFKDQNEEEKARRLLRKQKITEARKKRGGKSVAALKKKNKSGRRRRRHGTDSDDTSSSDYSDSSDDSDSSSSEDAEQKRLKHEQHERNWLDNDDFDYQNEDVNIKYDARKGLPTPDENAKRFDFVFGIGKKIEEREPPEAIDEQQQEEKAPVVTNNKKLTAMEKFLLQQKEKKQQALQKQKQQPQEKNQQDDAAAQTITTSNSSPSKAKILLIVGDKKNNTTKTSLSRRLTQEALQEHTKPLYDKLSELVHNPPQTKSTNNNNAGNQQQQQPLKSFEVWAREIRMTLCCMMEVIRTFLATFSAASSSLLLNQTNKKVSLRHLALRFLPMIEQNEKELKNDAVFIYEQSPVLLEEEESRGSNNDNRIVFNLVTRGCATKKGKKDSTTLRKRGKNDDDDDSSDDDDDETSSCSSSSSSDDDEEYENSVDEDAASPKKTKRKPTTKKINSNKKTKTNKSTTHQRKPTLAAEKKKMEEFNTKAKEHLLKKAQEVKAKLEDFEDFFCKQDADEVHHDQSNVSAITNINNQDAAVNDADDSSSSSPNNNNNTKSFQLSSNLIVEVETREIAEIEQQQQQFMSSSSSSFDLVVIDAVFTSQNEEMTKVRAKNLINIIQNATSSSLLLWIAPVLTRDRFHFMLTDTVREAFNHSSLPKFGHLLHQLCHPRALSCDEDEDVVSSPQQLSYLAESFLGEASLSEFDMVLSNCQRKVYCL